jgi:hypothetical protein
LEERDSWLKRSLLINVLHPAVCFHCVKTTSSRAIYFACIIVVILSFRPVRAPRGEAYGSGRWMVMHYNLKDWKIECFLHLGCLSKTTEWRKPFQATTFVIMAYHLYYYHNKLYVKALIDCCAVIFFRYKIHLYF